jgi:hypothetical protein
MRLRFALAIAVLLHAALPGAAAERPLAGRSLAAAIGELQARGLTIIYSSELVRPAMTVREEPRSTDLRKILEEILRPHRLDVHEAPGGVLVIVPAREAEPPPDPSPRGDPSPPAPPPVFIEEIVVTPSHLRLLEEQPEAKQFLSREEVDRMPHLADDLYRAVKQLPGTAGADFSAEFNVRGGDSDEMLVMLDGLELLQPFHLKDFFNAFSSLDSQAIGGVDLLTGGFPAEYGDRMSGVMDIAVRSPSGPLTTSVDIGTMNSRLLTSGSTGDGATQWLVSARGWYPAEAASLGGSLKEEIETDYFDVLAKVQQRLGRRSLLSLNFLASEDDIAFRAADAEETELLEAEYGSQQLWLNLHSQWTEGLSSVILLAAGEGSGERIGGVTDLVEGTLDVRDDRSFNFLQLKQDWRLTLSERQFLKFGVDVRRMRAEYDYLRSSTFEHAPGDVSIHLDPEGESYGAYVADRLRLGDRLVAEVGLRWDKQFWTNDHQISPRLNLMIMARPQSTVRLAWGRYSQTQRLNELAVEDGVSEFDRPQLAEHWLVGFEHRFARGPAMRIEAWSKEFDRVRPRYENLFNPVELFPEAQADRIRIDPEEGRAEGLELILKDDRGSRLTWWAGYTLSKAVDEVAEQEIPRSWDQRHAASFSVNLLFPRRWNANLGGTWHTGWPRTDVTGRVGGNPADPEVELVLGPRNAARYPSYLRFDLRVSKSIKTQLGDLTIIGEVINLTDRKNVCCIGDFETAVRDDGSVEVIPERTSWAPIIPSLAVRWQF